MKDELKKILKEKFFETMTACFKAGFTYGKSYTDSIADTDIEYLAFEKFIEETFVTKPKVVVFDDRFDIFWKAYPNKKAKPVAFKKWKRMKMDDELFGKIMSALEAHKKTPQWMKDDGQYIPHPSTWLNQQRWEDELKSEKSSENQSKFGHLS